MTREEAKQAMSKGKKVRHIDFAENYWITIEDNKIVSSKGTDILDTVNALFDLEDFDKAFTVSRFKRGGWEIYKD